MSTNTVRYKFTVDADLADKADKVASELGLDGLGEYLRLCMESLLEHGRPPFELDGRRSPMKVGRPKGARNKTKVMTVELHAGAAMAAAVPAHVQQAARS